MGTYGVNAALLVLAADIRALSRYPIASAGFVLATSGALAVLWAAYPRYWDSPGLVGPGGSAVGSTADGDPWIGAREPRVVIEEYSDYQCTHCQLGHHEIRRLVKQDRNLVRVVHRHFPLDQACNPLLRRPFHPNACEYARLALCAGRQGRFWEANDYLFEHGQRADAVSPAELATAEAWGSTPRFSSGVERARRPKRRCSATSPRA